MDYILKQKIITLYNENIDVINVVISKWSLPKLTNTNISSFVKLRNSKTHSGTIAWGENAEIYPALLALVYTCLFKHLGIPEEKIKPLIQQIFKERKLSNFKMFILPFLVKLVFDKKHKYI